MLRQSRTVWSIAFACVISFMGIGLVAPLDRSVASAAYSFVRFSGGAVAPWLAGTLGEFSARLPFWVGSGAVLAAVLVLLASRAHLRVAEEPADLELEADSIALGDA